DVERARRGTNTLLAGRRERLRARRECAPKLLVSTSRAAPAAHARCQAALPSVCSCDVPSRPCYKHADVVGCVLCGSSHAAASHAKQLTPFIAANVESDAREVRELAFLRGADVARIHIRDPVTERTCGSAAVMPQLGLVVRRFFACPMLGIGFVENAGELQQIRVSALSCCRHFYLLMRPSGRVCVICEVV